MILDNPSQEMNPVSGYQYRCESYSQQCIPGANKDFNEGFAMQDMPALW